LTFLTLKSALEVRDIHVDDGEIRKWLKDNDAGNKGYVDLDDFLRATIFFPPRPSNKGNDGRWTQEEEANEEAYLGRLGMAFGAGDGGKAYHAKRNQKEGERKKLLKRKRAISELRHLKKFKTLKTMFWISGIKSMRKLVNF
jgi:hypothetical protein